MTLVGKVSLNFTRSCFGETLLRARLSFHFWHLLVPSNEVRFQRWPRHACSEIYIISKRSDYPFLASLTPLRALGSNKNLKKLQATQKSLKKMFSILFSFLALTLPKRLKKIQKKLNFFDHFIVRAL